ncbi:MAG: glycosyltransferase [Candidatus Levybacteria bacterium]|nr:glycosyltransferase [Candidatus Levybacteria bacterium]
MLNKKGGDVCVVIPSYNSKSTLKKVIYGVLRNARIAKIIVVDDNSPDGTASIVKKYFLKESKVKLITRGNKGGRGSAVIEGFKEGLKNKNSEFFIEMDADLAHSPTDLPRLLEKAKEFDAVVTSRYLLKSQILRWKLKRRIASKLANLWIKFILGVPLSDNTNGFRCYRRRVIKAIDFNKIRSKGFIVLTEIANQIYKKGFRFGEIPIDFVPVDLNKSNLNWKEIKEAFFAVLRLRLSRSLVMEK